MNMFFHELKANRKNTLTWAITLALVTVFFLSIFPAFSHNATEVKKLLEGYPETLRRAIGISIDSIASLLGFYSYIFSYIVLCGSIQAMILGTGLISKEVREKTADFLLTKPVSRIQIMNAKLSAALVSLVVTNIIYLAIATIMARIVSTDFETKKFLMVSFSLFFVQLLFLALGTLFSTIWPKTKSVLAISLGTVFSFFIINAFAATTGEKVLRYLTPFQYYEPSKIIKNSSYELSFVAVEVVFIIVAVSTSYILYKKSDIDAV